MNLAMIMVLVDLVLGPALTMLVFRPAKPSLRFDLGVIALVQLSALVYGVMSIYQARPVYVAYVVDRFEMVSAADLEPALLAKAAAPFNRFPDRAPSWVHVELPRDRQELDKLTMAEALNGTGPALLPELYQAFDGRTALAKAKPVANLREFNEVGQVDRALAALGRDDDQVRYLPLHAIGRDMTVFVSAENGEVLEVADLRPWS
ncbi:MAG: hypothetical protein R3E87_24045 [Burkholderiaceae bacterium]